MAGGRRITNAYKIRRNGKSGFSIGVPAHIGDQLIELDVYFVAQFVEEGVLFKPLATIQPQQPLPDWVQARAE